MKQRTYRMQVEEIDGNCCQKADEKYVSADSQGGWKRSYFSACTDGGCAYLCICKGAYRLDQKI